MSAPDMSGFALSTTRPRTPLRPHCSATLSVASAGTTMIARSTGPGMSLIDLYVGIECTTPALALTG